MMGRLIMLLMAGMMGCTTIAAAQEQCLVVEVKDFETLSGQYYRRPVCLYAGRRSVLTANTFNGGLCIQQGQDVTFIDNRIVVAQSADQRFYPPMRPGTTVHFDASNSFIGNPTLRRFFCGDVR
jgi:hypothetical protein